ncbi:damage-inducible protein DinB [Nonlabens spongiae]|uniref:Damage-inducible protein DinB n=1 Tax=Nonlabens spongiae TaxID=331648 RepID=A0A1W6MIA3_9FLAO|nr:DinB family protein [Nonlabens spongiae]ARN77226.1 damage-inducible protein DinB [Nonlabens spongiae]
MKRILITCMFLLAMQSTFSQTKDYVDQFIERLERSKDYLLLVADMMPEEDYHYRTTADSNSFAEHLMHIGWAMDWHSQTLMGERPARDWETDTLLKVDNKTKEEMISTMSDAFDNTIRFLKEFDESRLGERLDYFGADRTKLQIMMLLADHITHHRGQMLVLLRLKGIKPPRYVLYQ